MSAKIKIKAGSFPKSSSVGHPGRMNVDPNIVPNDVDVSNYTYELIEWCSLDFYKRNKKLFKIKNENKRNKRKNP